MARKKNAQPKRRLEVDSVEGSNHNKRSKGPQEVFFFPDDRTTNVIPADNENPILATLPTFTKALKEKLPQMMNTYKEALLGGKSDSNGWYKGFRLITGDRVEIKLLSEWLVEEFDAVTTWKPKELVQYAQLQACKDERIIHNILEPNGGKICFSEWSMVINQGACEAQTFHIDVPANNYQFGLVLQDGAKGTMVVEKHNGKETPERLCDQAWVNAPQALKDCLLKNDTTKKRMQQVLNAYGGLLMPRKELEAAMVGGDKPLVTGGLKCGDLICTAGGIPHAGPACRDFRVVVFAAVAPDKGSLYNVDEQYYAHSAILFAIQILWDGLAGQPLESRRWLLQRLAHTVRDYERGPISNHQLVSSPFTQLMHQMADVYHGQSGEGDDAVTNNQLNESNTTMVSSNKPPGSTIAQLIGNFLVENDSKSEQSLFQYRESNIWNVV